MSSTVIAGGLLSSAVVKRQYWIAFRVKIPGADGSAILVYRKSPPGNTCVFAQSQQAVGVVVAFGDNICTGVECPGNAGNTICFVQCWLRIFA